MQTSPWSLRFAVLALGVSALPIHAAAQNNVPRLQSRACDFALPRAYSRDVRECKWLVVPENRARPNGRTFRLAVVVYRAQEPDGSPPLLLLHGGPGGAGGARAPWTEMEFPLARRRDVITLDYRGVAASEPSICPDFETFAAPAFYLPARNEWEEGYRSAVRQCVANLNAQGLDRSAYGASVFATDVIDLRHALGYTQWDLYGGSYGAVVAQELMRKDARGTHAAVLASGSAPGPHYAARFLGADYQRLLEQVFTACAAQPACHSAFPNLEPDFYALYDEYSKNPVQVAIAVPAPASSVLLTGDRFLMHMYEQLRTQNSIGRLPLLINELRRGNRQSALARLVADGRIPPWDALGHIVWCNDYGKAYRATVASYKQSVKPVFHTISDDFREHCDLWLPEPVGQLDTLPIAGAIPTLVVHGEFDPTEPEFAQPRMTAKLPHAYAFTFPGETHANPSVGCHGAIVQQFLENPARAPDSSCLTSMPRIQFATSLEGRLTLAIESQGADGQPFAGVWEAAFGGARDWVIALKLSADTVTGGVTFPAVAVYDGRIEGSTFRFKLKAPNGRVITFTARLAGAELNITRDVEVPAGAPPGGVGLFGTMAATELTARRVR